MVNEFSIPKLPTVDRFEIGQRIDELREKYGPTNWLTVVGGVVARAYRQAGMTPEEFATILIDGQNARGKVLVHSRHEGCRRLREALGGGKGELIDGEGLVAIELAASPFRYLERDGLLTTSLETIPSALFVTGGLNRPLGQLIPTAPKCLAGLRVRRVRRAMYGAQFDVVDSFETLGLMPDDVADKLGLTRQKHLAHIPWAGVEGPRPAPTLPSRDPSSAPPKPRRRRPKLRLVSG